MPRLHLGLSYECVFVPLKLPCSHLSRLLRSDGEMVGHEDEPADVQRALQVPAWKILGSDHVSEAVFTAEWHVDYGRMQDLQMGGPARHLLCFLGSELSIEARDVLVRAALKDSGPPADRSVPPPAKSSSMRDARLRYDPEEVCI